MSSPAPAPSPADVADIVWRPTPELAAASNLQRFMDRHGIASYADLMERSTADVAWFWDAVLKELDVRFLRPTRESSTSRPGSSGRGGASAA